jgi:methylmalonyl-CoA mutase N-terminal domain/subunit
VALGLAEVRVAGTGVHHITDENRFCDGIDLALVAEVVSFQINKPRICRLSEWVSVILVQDVDGGLKLIAKTTSRAM